MEASISGHAQPRQRTLDVEVNLLSEWLERRVKTREQTTRSAICRAVSALLVAVAIPLLFRTASAAAGRATALKLASGTAAKRVEALEKQRLAALPRVDEAEMRIAVRRQARQFLGQTAIVLNAALPGMAVEVLGVEVLGGELTLRCKADAENSKVAEHFLDGAGKGPNALSILLSNSQRNGRLGPDGVGFEMVKRVEVNP